MRTNFFSRANFGAIFLILLFLLSSVSLVACTPAPQKETVAEASKETAPDAAAENPQEPAPEPKAEPAPEPKAEPAPEPKAEPAPEPKAEPAPEPTPDDGGTNPEPAPEKKPDTGKALSYATDILPLLQKKGCTGPYCHGGGGGLSLQGGASSLKNLINKTANAGKVLVTPGDLKKSYFYVKLLPNPPKGKQMPRNGMPLSAAEQKLVADWILQGAKP